MKYGVIRLRRAWF